MTPMIDLRVAGALDSPEVLVPLARAGDRTAFARIVRLHRTDMVRVAWVVTLDPRLAREAVASAWPLASKRLGRLRDPGRLGPWLCALAAAEARAVASRGPGRSPDPTTHGGDRPPGERPLPDDPGLDRFLRRLTPDERLLLALRHVAGATPDEIARAAGRAPEVARARSSELERRFGGGPSGELEARLRAFAAIPVAHVDIDAEARRAIVTRDDRRNRIASLAIAAIVAMAVVSIPHLLGGGAVAVPGVVPSPSPSASPSPSSPPFTDALAGEAGPGS
jgi:DNA-directed RNA polymerase specialized sigma24 family protein